MSASRCSRVAPFLLAVFVLAGCGKAAAGLSRGVIDQAHAQGVAPDMIYSITLPGYEIAEQSAGVIGDDGFGAFWVAKDGKRVQLRVDRRAFSDEICATMPVMDAEPAAAQPRCDRDDVGWFRVAGGQQEYVRLDGAAMLRLGGKEGELDRAALKAAIAGAKPVEGSASPLPPRTPVPRGDLPSNGDGAPDNHVGPGG